MNTTTPAPDATTRTWAKILAYASLTGAGLLLIATLTSGKVLPPWAVGMVFVFFNVGLVAGVIAHHDPDQEPDDPDATHQREER